MDDYTKEEARAERAPWPVVNSNEPARAFRG